LTQLREGEVDIQFLVERLEALVVNARKVPMTSQVILEQAAVLDLIDQLRVAIPEEVKQARRINQETDRVLTKAREEAEQIIGAAQEQAALLLQDQSIVREAESRAQDVLDRTQSKAEETMRGADQYAADVLVRLESDLVKTLSVIKKSLEVLEERRAAQEKDTLMGVGTPRG
jgi:vacuolar-type H+-ATPase subunit H